ncbi:helix-turn-helix domain-containing protein [Paenibacillus ehimensis]|uniref:helix-turn-helix domain-containing protein n=1 Tax=Paenibacillus ehimensis TaxID=79264 RepID=UPI00056B140C|nr:helix-turn-helix transcriptional regulator [Paenibacillus ehimensis]MEC0211837.1 helix-turn-helix transcriptional regulator [Paenibacillus ehimensis]
MLQYWLNHKGLSQADLSRHTGYSTRIISHWCTDDRKMSVEAMYTVATFLGIHMEQLYQWKLEP